MCFCAGFDRIRPILYSVGGRKGLRNQTRPGEHYFERKLAIGVNQSFAWVYEKTPQAVMRGPRHAFPPTHIAC